MSVILARIVNSLILIPLAGMLGTAGTAVAQDGTPTPPSITVDLYLETQTGDGQVVTLLRATFDPGAEALSHRHPGTSIFYVESGTITFIIEEGAVLVTRSATDGQAATEPEEITAVNEVILNPGDSIVYSGDAVVTDANYGDEPATVIVTSVRGAEEPFSAPHEATPVS